MRFLILHVIFLLLLSAGDVFASGRPPAPQFTPGPDNGQPVLSVRNFARHYGFDRIDRQEDRVVLKGEVHELVLFQGSRRALLNGTLVWLNEPVVVHRKTWVLTERDVRFTLAPVLRPFTVLHDQGFQVVVLDPGHGGEDPGALSPSGLQEKEVVLDVARRVRALLLRQGVRVYLTRHDDRFLELDERPRRAGRWQVDAFVSLHVNSGAATALGAETFVLSLPGSLSTNQNPASPAPTNSYPGNTLNGPNMALAYSLHHALRSVPGVVDRGVKRARFSVLRQSPAPAALVEMGFLSHPEEGKKFQDSAYRDEMARSIARGIDNYLRAVKKARMASEAQQQEKN
jgi:N-acetylmuramoyl-L-alanine amidase